MTATIRNYTSATTTSGTNSTTITLNSFSDMKEGELLLAFLNLPVSTITPPSGWELVGSFTASTGNQSELWQKRVTASEPASYTWTSSITSAIVGSLLCISGANGILQWDAMTQTSDATPNTRQLDAARDSMSLKVLAWRDGATATFSGVSGEIIDTVTANSGSTIFRGMVVAGRSPGGNLSTLDDTINAGDSESNATWTPSAGAIDYSIGWIVLLDNALPDEEEWSSTEGDFTVELELDRIEMGSNSSISSPLKGDVTGLIETITSSGDNPPNEIDDNLADGLSTTKWLVSGDSGWVQYDFGSGNAKTVKRYRLTAANDNRVRDPMDWILKGSNNGTDFTDLDVREGVGFGSRYEVQEFRVSSPGEYRYYRLDISSNFSPASASSVQLAEWRLSVHDTWEDVTERVRWDDKIRITRGFQGAAGRHDFSRAYFTLKNADGRFSLSNPDSPYYGSLQRNTRVRISKPYGDPSLQLQGAVALAGTNMIGDCVRTPLTDDLMVTGDIDVRIDLHPESWRDEQMLAGVDSQQTDFFGSVESWAFYLDDNGLLNWTHTPSGGTALTYQSTRSVPNGGRLTLRVTLDVNNGASGSTVTFYYSSDGATWTRLGDPVTESGTTSIGYTGGALCVGHVGGKDQRGIHGRVYSFAVYDGIAGTRVAGATLSSVANGSRSFTDLDGNLWTAINNAVISNRRYRFHGEVSEWPLYWDATGTDVNVPVTAAGIQKRLERGSSELSALHRHHTKGVISDPGAFERYAEPVAYWPCEDLKDTVRISSAIPNAPHMEVYGAPEFENYSDFPGSRALPMLKNAQLGGRIGPIPRTGYVDIRWVMHVPETIATNSVILSVYTVGTMRKWEIVYTGTNEWTVKGYDEEGVESNTVTHGTAALPVTTIGQQMYCQFTLDDSGGNLNYGLDVWNPYGARLGGDDGLTQFGGESFVRVSRVNVNSGTTKMNEVIVGHIAVYSSEDSPPASVVLGASRREAAGARLARLSAEEDVEYRYVGAEAQSALLGAQDTASPFPLMSTCSVSDEGFLTDPLDAFGLEYRTGRSLYNQAPHLTLSYTGNYLSGELTPSPDDSHIVNDFTASRGEAGSARFRRDDGPLSVNAPPDGVGEYSGSQSYSFAHEGQCVQMASWQVHKGTLEEARYPRIQIALENPRVAADPGLIEAILTLDVGRRVDITDLPDFLPPEDIRQIVIGYEEWFDNFQHDFTLNTLPERVYEIAEYDAGDNVDTYDTALYGDHSDTTTELTVLTSTGPGMTYDPRAYPFDIRVNGEVMRVLAPGSMVTPNPLFTDGVTGWTVSSGAVTQSTDYVFPYSPLATASAKFTPAGAGAASEDMASALSGVGTVQPQRDYIVSGWFYSPTGHSDIRPAVHWYNSASTFLSSAGDAQAALPAGVWTYYEDTVTAPANASQVKARGRIGGTPAASDIFYVWNLKVTEARPMYGDDTADSFNRADSTTTPGSTDQGTVQAWTEDLGAWGISSNRAYISAAGNSIMTIAGSYDFEELSVEVPTWGADDAWLIFRCTDVNNRVRWGGTVGSRPQLQVINAGVITVDLSPDVNLASTERILAAGDKLSVRCQGSVIECFLDDKLILSISDETEQGTRVGLQVDTTAIRFDNFVYVESEATQQLQVERAVGTQAYHHKAESGVSLYRPPYRGL